MARYSITLADPAGVFATYDTNDFPGCIRMVVALARQYPDKVLTVCNLDRCDLGTNGLTEDERDALDEVM